MAFLTVDKPVSRFYVFVPGNFHIPGGPVNGRPDFRGNLYHMIAILPPITYYAWKTQTGNLREKFLKK